MAVVADLLRGVQADARLELFHLAVLGAGADGGVVAVLEAALDGGGEALDLVDLAAGQAQALDAGAGGELQGGDPHPHQVAAVDALVALGDDGADAEQQRPLGRPVARASPVPILAGEDDQSARPRPGTSSPPKARLGDVSCSRSAVALVPPLRQPGAGGVDCLFPSAGSYRSLKPDLSGAPHSTGIHARARLAPARRPENPRRPAMNGFPLRPWRRRGSVTGRAHDRPSRWPPRFGSPAPAA